MIELPDPPRDSGIVALRRGEAARLSWPGRPWPRGRAADVLDRAATVLAVALAAVHAFWMFGMVFGMLMFHLSTGVRPFGPEPRHSAAATLIHVALSAVFIWAAWTMARNRLRYRSRETLVLDGRFLVHFPPRRAPRLPYHPYADLSAFGEELRELGPDARALVPGGPSPRRSGYGRAGGACAFVRKADVTAVAVEGRGSFGVVSVKVGDHDVDLGRRLGEVEREWLCEVLRSWLAEGGGA